MLLDPAVHQHVAWAGIKAAGEQAVIQQGHIGHAADVHDGNALICPGEKLPVKGWHQRGALPAQCHVLVAEITDHGNLTLHRQGVRAAQLNAKAWCLRAVANGLAVAANGANLGRCQAGLCQQGLTGNGVLNGQLLADTSGQVDFITAGLAQGQNIIAKRGRDRLAQGAEQGEMVVTNAGEDGINAVHAGAGHQADKQRWIGLRRHRCWPVLTLRRTGSSVLSAD